MEQIIKRMGRGVAMPSHIQSLLQKTSTYNNNGNPRTNKTMKLKLSISETDTRITLMVYCQKKRSKNQ